MKTEFKIQDKCGKRQWKIWVDYDKNHEVFIIMKIAVDVIINLIKLFG